MKINSWLEIIFKWLLILFCSGVMSSDSDESEKLSGSQDELMQVAGYPKLGDIPILNRKIFKGHRVSIREHPYVASIRRQYIHYLTGTLVTKTMVITVAHGLLDVPVTELNVVLGENYADRGTALLTVILVIIHEHFDPYTLENDIALVRIFEAVAFKGNVKDIRLLPISGTALDGQKAFVTGWGRCDRTGTEFCLERTSRFYPGEKVDPMLRTVIFTLRSHNFYCEGYQRHGIALRHGMLCLGEAREENRVAPCLGAPGAPLVVNERLLGVLSWGFGCGYSYDLPLVYTDLRYYQPWIMHNIRIMMSLKQSNFTPLFEGTKAWVLSQWLQATRNITPNSLIRTNMRLELLDLDNILVQIKGTLTDVRDYIMDGKFKTQKQDLYENLRSEYERVNPSRPMPSTKPSVPRRTGPWGPERSKWGL